MVEVEHSESEQKRKSLLLSRVTPGTALLVIGAILVLRLWVVETAYVEGRSMQDTLQQGDRVLISKLAKPQRFDIVLVEDPEDRATDIKRIVGLPGDVISMVPHVAGVGQSRVVYGSQLYLEGQPYEEPYATSAIPSSLPPRKPTVTIPQGTGTTPGTNTSPGMVRGFGAAATGTATVTVRPRPSPSTCARSSRRS